MKVTDYITLPIEVQQLITPEQAWHYHVVPKQGNDQELSFYVDEEKYSKEIENELEILFGKKILTERIESNTLTKTIGKYYRKTTTNGKAVEIGNNEANDFLAKLIAEAKSLNSSDIHIEIYDEKARVRIRIDGLLVERYKLNKQDYPALINKIKIRSHLDISEKRLPQDGRINFNEGDIKIDIRVSVLPTLYGEKVVMRLLSNDATSINIEELGFSKKQLENYMLGIKKPHGIILMSGPTGSGKTTTLYATLKILNEEKRNIVTVEDPIEYTLEGINQVQLKESIGLDFASALKTFLRQDPDVIMLGEIRDVETAQMAVRAALTGHLVLSTIHTNSAWGTISRLIDMGVPPFLLASTINTTAAQRLVRLLCNDCKKEIDFVESSFPPQFKPLQKVLTHFKAEGCENCHYTGYKGRKAVYEIINVDQQLSDCIKNNVFDIEEDLKERNISTVSQNAFELFIKGKTSIEEIYPLLLT